MGEQLRLVESLTDDSEASSFQYNNLGYTPSLGREDPTPRIRRSVLKRKSFIEEFRSANGPPQIVAVVVMASLATGATVGIIPSIMTERFARLNHGFDVGDSCLAYKTYAEKPEACILGNADAQNAAAISGFVANCLTLLTSSLIGSITDVHGRRGMFLLGLLITTLHPFSFLYVFARPEGNPFVFYLARALTGFVNWMAIALSSFADVLPPKWRAPGVGLLMAGFWAGICLTPTVALFASNQTIVIFSCVMQVIALVFAIAFFPETLPQHAAEEARLRCEEEVAGKKPLERIIWNLSRPIRELSIVNRNSFFRLLSSLAFFSGMVSAGDQTLILYYVDSKLSFTPKDMATLFLLFGIGAMMVQLLILKPLNDCIGERLVVVVSFFASTISNTVYGCAMDKQTFLAGVCVGALSSMAFPTISAIKANNVGESEQGRIQGALYSIQAVAGGVGPVLMRYVDHLARKLSLGPGTMFDFLAVLQLVSLYFAFRLPKDKANSRRGPETVEQCDGEMTLI